MLHFYFWFIFQQEVCWFKASCEEPVSSELVAAEHAETLEAAVVSLLLLLLQHLLLPRETTLRKHHRRRRRIPPPKPNSEDREWVFIHRNQVCWTHQSFLLELLSEESIFWKNVTQQEVVLLFLCKNKLFSESFEDNVSIKFQIN